MTVTLPRFPLDSKYIKRADARAAGADVPAQENPDRLIWKAPTAVDFMIQFVDSPANAPETGSWYKWREASFAQKIQVPGTWSKKCKWLPAKKDGGFRPRSEVPFMLQDVPVADVIPVEMPDGSLDWTFGGLDTVLIGGQPKVITSQIIDPGSSQYSSEGHFPVGWTWGIDVIVHAWPVGKRADGSELPRPAVGSQIVIKMSNNHAEQLKEKLQMAINAARRFDPNYDFRGDVWKIHAEKGRGGTLTLEQVTTAPIPAVIPLNIPPMIDELRSTWEQFIQDVYADCYEEMGVGIAPTAPSAPEQPAAPVAAMPAAVVPAPAAPEVAAEPTSAMAAINWDIAGLSKLKDGLKAYGIEVPPGTTRTQMVEMIKQAANA